TKVQLTATGGDVVVDTWVMERKGVAADSSFASVDIVDLTTNATINESGKTFSTDHTANFTEDLTIPSGQTKYVMLAGNIAASPGAGEQPILALKSMTLKGGSLVASFPIQGNAMTINTTITIGSATVQRGAYTNSSSTTIEVGKTAYTFFSFQIQAGSVEDVGFSQIKVYQSGTASLSADLANIKLYRDGTFLADGVVSGNYVNFSFAEQLIPKGQTFQYQVKADVVSGSDRTVKLAIWRVNDVYVVGKTYNAGITPTYSGTSSANGTNTTLVLTDNQFTISVGTFRVGSSNSVPAQNISVGTNQTLGAFEFEVKGEPMIVSAVTLTVASSTTGATIIEDALQAVSLVDPNGNIVAGPTDVSTGSGTMTVPWTDTFTVPIGLNHYKVVGNLATDGGWTSNNTITVSLQTPASAITSKGEVTGLSVTETPASNTSANTQTVKASTLTVTKNSTPTAKTIVANATNVLLGSWQMDATNSGEDIRITSIAVRASTTGKLNTLTLKKVSSPGGTVLTTLSPVNDNPSDNGANSNDAAATSTFALSDPIVITKGTAIHIDLYGNVPSNVNAGEVDSYGLTDTATASNASVVAYGVSTGNRATVTLTANDGAALTIAAAGTLTVDEDASSPNSRLVTFGSNGVEVSTLRLKATNESIDITVLNIHVDDGGLTGTNSGDYTQVKKLYLKLDGTLVGNTDGYSLGAARTTINFERGALTIPEGVTGKKLSIVADIVEIGTNQPGEANDDIVIGLGGTTSITSTGNGSNTAATETFNDGTGSAIILHRSVPQVVIETPTNNLFTSSVLHRAKVSAVGNTIGLYRLSYGVSSSTGIRFTNGYVKLITCGGCAGVPDGTQLANTVAVGTYLADGTDSYSFTLNGTALGKNFLQIGATQTAVIDFFATFSDDSTADTESVSTSLLGDTATTSPNDVAGAQAAGFSSLQQGNFVWSDLNSDDTNGSGHTTKQWYNGYYVSGLGPTTTSTAVTVSQ
ncbi:MAG: hypothetical protein U1C57_01765, partial [Candidatus Doudnabacteria bacterium]|nr:hypothetical protein [Candidatus Doudnabacteria bacterium]